MEIPAKYILTMNDIGVNTSPESGEPDGLAPIIGRRYGRIYVPESWITHADQEYVLQELRTEELFHLVGPAIDRVHFGKTGELREHALNENSVNFWTFYEFDNHESGGTNV